MGFEETKVGKVSWRAPKPIGRGRRGSAEQGLVNAARIRVVEFGGGVDRP